MTDHDERKKRVPPAQDKASEVKNLKVRVHSGAMRE